MVQSPNYGALGKREGGRDEKDGGKERGRGGGEKEWRNGGEKERRNGGECVRREGGVRGGDIWGSEVENNSDNSLTIIILIKFETPKMH